MSSLGKSLAAQMKAPRRSDSERRPVGCFCNASDWGKKRSIPVPCGGFVDDGDGYCFKCEHLPECHDE